MPTPTGIDLKDSESLLIVAPHCLRCGPARELVERLNAELPGTTIRELEWTRATEGTAARLDPPSRARSGGASFPVLVLDGRVLYGYLNDAHTGGRIRNALRGRPPGTVSMPNPVLYVPGLGQLHADEAPRALFTTTVGSLDGLHPTAPWALLLLLPLVLGVAGVRRVAALGAVFLGSDHLGVPRKAQLAFILGYISIMSPPVVMMIQYFQVPS